MIYDVRHKMYDSVIKIFQFLLQVVSRKTQ